MHRPNSRLRREYFARMSERFVKSAFCNINHRDRASLCIEEHDSKYLLIEELHVGTGSVDRFGIVKHVRTSVFTLCDCRHREGSHHRLSFAAREELTDVLKRSAGQRLYGTEVTDQS